MLSGALGASWGRLLEEDVMFANTGMVLVLSSDVRFFFLRPHCYYRFIVSGCPMISLSRLFDLDVALIMDTMY